jgi:N-acetylmuramoyl-L-alanine amidase
MLTLNTTGLQVVRLQMQLRQLNYFRGNIDGYFDETIMQAVKAFQTANKLQADGIVGPVTQNALNAATADGWHVLFLHCAATPEGRDVKAEQVVQFHTLPVEKGGRGWSKPGYSDIIELSGRLVNVWAWDSDNQIKEWEQTWGVHGSTMLNRNARHLCYIGGTEAGNINIPKDTRTEGQMGTMETYIKFCLLRNPKIIIAGHNQVQQKGCPSFDVPKYLRSIGIPEWNIGQWSSKFAI